MGSDSGDCKKSQMKSHSCGQRKLLYPFSSKSGVESALDETDNVSFFLLKKPNKFLTKIESQDLVQLTGR